MRLVSTRLTIHGIKAHVDDGDTPLMGFRPVLRAVTTRTQRCLRVPVNVKTRVIKPQPCARLPAIVGQHRADQIDPIMGGQGHEMIRAHVACIQKLLIRQQITGG